MIWKEKEIKLVEVNAMNRKGSVRRDSKDTYNTNISVRHFMPRRDKCIDQIRFQNFDDKRENLENI